MKSGKIMCQKKILFISYFYPPVGGKGLPGVQRSIKFIRYFNQFDKYVLTLKQECYPIFFTQDNKTKLPANNEIIIRTGKFDLFEIFLYIKNFLIKVTQKKNDIQITEHPTTKNQKSNIKVQVVTRKSAFSRFKDMISFILTFPDFANPWIIPAIINGRKIVQKNNIDVIFTTGLPWSALIIGAFIRMTTKTKLMVDFRDPWVGNPFAIDKSRIQKAIERAIERWIIRVADIISLNTEELRKDFIERYPEENISKFITIPNGYDSSDFTFIELKNSKETEKILSIAHAGYIYGVRDPKPIFQSLAHLSKENNTNIQNIKFKQMGYVDLNYDLNAYLQEKSLQKNFENIGPIPYNKCLQLMADSDILLIIQANTKTQIPSKLYEYIYLNKPILTIAQKDGALGKMIEEYQFGDLFEPDDIEGIANYIKQKLSEKESKGFLKVNYAHRTEFDVQNIASRVEALFQQL